MTENDGKWPVTQPISVPVDQPKLLRKQHVDARGHGYSHHVGYDPCRHAQLSCQHNRQTDRYSFSVLYTDSRFEKNIKISISRIYSND